MFANIDLSDNNLTRFDTFVYKPILEQLKKTRIGKIFYKKLDLQNSKKSFYNTNVQNVFDKNKSVFFFKQILVSFIFNFPCFFSTILDSFQILLTATATRATWLGSSAIIGTYSLRSLTSSVQMARLFWNYTSMIFFIVNNCNCKSILKNLKTRFILSFI